MDPPAPLTVQDHRKSLRLVVSGKSGILRLGAPLFALFPNLTAMHVTASMVIVEQLPLHLEALYLNAVDVICGVGNKHNLDFSSTRLRELVFDKACAADCEGSLLLPATIQRLQLNRTMTAEVEVSGQGQSLRLVRMYEEYPFPEVFMQQHCCVQTYI